MRDTYIVEAYRGCRFYIVFLQSDTLFIKRKDQQIREGGGGVPLYIHYVYTSAKGGEGSGWAYIVERVAVQISA